MATFYGVNATLQLAATAPTSRQPVGKDYGGDVKAVFDTYVSLGTEAAASLIVMGRARKGWRMLAWDIAYGALGTNVTLAMGDDGSGTRFKAATAAATAGTLGAAWTKDNLGYLFTQDRPLILTTAGATLDAAITIVSRALFLRA